MASKLNRSDPFDDFFHGFFVRPVDVGAGSQAPAIKIDIKEKEGSYLVHAELPGIQKEDIQIGIEDSIVTLSAVRKQEKEMNEGERVLRSERYFGKVSRSFDLGSDIDESLSTAKYMDGVLELTLKRKSLAPSKKLRVQ